MNFMNRTPGYFAIAAFAAVVAGCATQPATPLPQQPQAGSVLRAVKMDAAVEDRILALDPERITETDVRDTLSKGPTPQIILLHGGVYPVHLAMTSFGRF